MTHCMGCVLVEDAVTDLRLDDVHELRLHYVYHRYLRLYHTYIINIMSCVPHGDHVQVHRDDLRVCTSWPRTCMNPKCTYSCM